MGRGSENLPLARASRPSAVGALRRVPCLADYTGGRLSFGNERAVPLVFPSRRSRDARAARTARCGSPHGILARKRAVMTARCVRRERRSPARRCGADGKARRARRRQGQDHPTRRGCDLAPRLPVHRPEPRNGLGRARGLRRGIGRTRQRPSQRIERGHPKRTLKGELRKQAMMGHGKPPCCRDWRRQREGRGTPGHRTAKRPACRTAGEPIYAVNWGDR